MSAAVSRWLHALAGLGGAVAAVQGLSFVANIIVVRNLSVAEYAVLTSSLSILGVLTAIADSGLSQAALTVGGLHHRDESEKAQVLQRCRRLIWVTGSIGLVAIAPVWIWVSMRLDASGESVILTGIFLFGGFFLVLGLNILKSHMLLDGHRVLVQKVEVGKTVARLLLLTIGVTLLPSAAYVIACGVVAEAIAWIVFRKTLAHHIALNVECTPQIASEINKVFFRMMPASIYRALSSQIFLLLLIGLGSVSSVAGAGALSKFQQCFILVPSVVAMVLSPRLARTLGYRQRNIKFVGFTFLGWMGAIGTWLVLVVLTEPLLAMFGGEYTGLEQEMRVFVTGSCLFTMTGVVGALLNMRGWIIPPQLYIGADLCFAILAIVVCDPSSLMGFVTMTCILSGGSLLAYIGWAIYCLLFKTRSVFA